MHSQWDRVECESSLCAGPMRSAWSPQESNKCCLRSVVVTDHGCLLARSLFWLFSSKKNWEFYQERRDETSFDHDDTIQREYREITCSTVSKISSRGGGVDNRKSGSSSCTCDKIHVDCRCELSRVYSGQLFLCLTFFTLQECRITCGKDATLEMRRNWRRGCSVARKLSSFCISSDWWKKYLFIYSK